MKIKFITAIYNNLFGTEYGGRSNRKDHYSFSLLSLLKMTDADFLCYTNENEIEELQNFFYSNHNISREKLKFEIFDLSETKFGDIINQHKSIESTKKSDRCIEIQYSKFHWWWKEDGSYDYYYWIDAGLSHCGLIPNKYLKGPEYGYRQFFESELFNNNFLKNLIDFSSEKIFFILKENNRNYWSATVDSKWYNNYSMAYHVVGGLFGGKKENWDVLVNTFEKYVYDIITTDHNIPMEENVMSLMYYNHQEMFNYKTFDTWWCRDNGPYGLDDNYFVINKSFYKILEELNGIYE